MKHIGIVALLLLMAAGAGESTAQTKTDTTKVKSDSITWSKELDGVVIKAQKQLVKQEIDRIGYDVQADEDSKTQTVMDMLRKVPMVTVDGQDNILVKGNSSYKIYKNGHYDPSLSKNAKETFKSMPASMVKRIEVVTDPGAREMYTEVYSTHALGAEISAINGTFCISFMQLFTTDVYLNAFLSELKQIGLDYTVLERRPIRVASVADYRK